MWMQTWKVKPFLFSSSCSAGLKSDSKTHGKCCGACFNRAMLKSAVINTASSFREMLEPCFCQRPQAQVVHRSTCFSPAPWGKKENSSVSVGDPDKGAMGSVRCLPVLPWSVFHPRAVRKPPPPQLGAVRHTSLAAWSAPPQPLWLTSSWITAKDC